MTEKKPDKSFIKQFEALKAGVITKEQLRKETSISLKRFKKRVAKLKAKIEQLKKQEEQTNGEQTKLSDSNRNTKE